MPIEILGVFLAMTFDIAIREFMDLHDRSWYHWWIFILFIANKIRFFQGDIVFSKQLLKVTKADTGVRAVGFFLGITSLFFVLVTAFNIASPANFFGFNAVATLIDIFWIADLYKAVDPKKDKGERLHRVLNAWIGLDALATTTSLIVCLVLTFFQQPDVTYWALVVGLSVMSIEGFLDYAWNSRMYFGS
jgi:hypothetical protein